MGHESPLLAVGVLGPLEVFSGGCPVELTAPRLRNLLAVLAMSAGRTVSVDSLAAAVWGVDLPADARRSVQTYVSRLRTAVGHIASRPGGYLLDVAPDQVDALRFIRLLEGVPLAEDDTVRRARLAAALELWRGVPFDGLRSPVLEQAEAPRLVERYLAALEQRIDLDIAAGHSAELIAELSQLTGEYPLRESLWLRHLVVLDRCGRLAEALSRYETIRRRLAEELGTDPGPELRRLYADLLAGRSPQLTGAAGPTVRPAPRQLPTNLDVFTGRADHIKALDTLLPIGAATRVAVVHGQAGVGKTALAVHWAHAVADRFPDGQLYVDLRGFDPSGTPKTPAEVVWGLLDTLGVPTDRIPASEEAQAGLYRSMLADKRALVLLDNARDAEQVRPVLPGAAGCLVVVTSRNQLSSLVATHAAQPLELDVPSFAEAREMLARRLGPDRIAAEPAAVDGILTATARLPLALAVVAARAATHPRFRLAALAAELRGGLHAFSGQDAATDVRTVFSWSYHTLSPGAAWMFRLLSTHAGPDISAAAAASLAGLAGRDVALADAALAELCSAHLLSEHTPRRYAFHDLLRAYAAELAQTHDSSDARRAATHRLLDHYLHSARGAAALLDPHQEYAPVPAPEPGVVPEDLTSYQHAMEWFIVERPALLATIGQASDAGFDTHTWRLAWTLATFLDRRGHWHDRVFIQGIALEAARRLGNLPEQVRAHRGLAFAYTRLSRFDDAYHHLQQALDLSRALGDITAQALSEHNLSWLLDEQDRYAEALGHAQRSLDLFRTAGHALGQARSLNAVGYHEALLGNPRKALVPLQRALALHQQLDDQEGEAATWDSLGYAHHLLGHTPQAIDCYQHAVDQRRDLGERYGQAGSLTRLGDVYQKAGDATAAQHRWRQALTILDELAHPDAEQIRVKLTPRAPARVFGHELPELEHQPEAGTP